MIKLFSLSQNVAEIAKKSPWQKRRKQASCRLPYIRYYWMCKIIFVVAAFEKLQRLRECRYSYVHEIRFLLFRSQWPWSLIFWL